jgi:hypothetical protein
MGYKVVKAVIIVSLILFSLPITTLTTASEVSNEWNKTYGENATASSIIQTNDEGYALAGSVISPGTTNRSFYIIKTDKNGKLQWNKTFSGEGNEYEYSLIQTSDGGYALAGSIDVGEVGKRDYLLIKTDSTGDVVWNKTYGEAGINDCYSAIQTKDDGYLLAGYMRFSPQLWSCWLVKTDSVGNQIWNKTYTLGGIYEPVVYNSVIHSVIQTSDGGYVFAGSSTAVVSSGFGGNSWLIKTDSEGNQVWSEMYVGKGISAASTVLQTSDGGYALAGNTRELNGSISYSWLVKTDVTGHAQWDKTYGGAAIDYAASFVQTREQGYALAGFTLSSSNNRNNQIASLSETDANGNELWHRRYGGTGDYAASAIVQTNDGGYAIAGTANPNLSGNLVWFIKTDENGNAPSTPATDSIQPQTPSPSPTSTGSFSPKPSPSIPEFSSTSLTATFLVVMTLLGVVALGRKKNLR